MSDVVRCEIDLQAGDLAKTPPGISFSWKKARKLLNQANPNQREAFLKTLEGLFDDALHERCLVVYLDKVHVQLDTNKGYGWSICSQRFWVSSSSPGLVKVSFYGLYLYNLGQVRIWPFDRANKENTV